VLAEAYQKVEATTKRLEMTAFLVELFRKTPRGFCAGWCTSPRAGSTPIS